VKVFWKICEISYWIAATLGATVLFSMLVGIILSKIV